MENCDKVILLNPHFDFVEEEVFSSFDSSLQSLHETTQPEYSLANNSNFSIELLG